jgi:L-alanine-DL-glutamate epimerase-like enolase superfamily enzyme
LITAPFRPDANGYLTIPVDRPGLGIELNRDALAQYGVKD